MWDDDEMSPKRDAYREHLRAMTTARQAAEHAYAARQPTPEARQRADMIFKQEMARIEAEHQAWLLEHGSDPGQEPPKHQRRGKRR
jgi:hypothetical protein